MNADWKATTLGAICDSGGGEIKTGPFGSQLHEADYSDEGAPVIMPKDIVNGRVDVTSIARVSLEHVARLSQHKLNPGDIVYGRRGDIGRKAFIGERETGWLCGTGCLRITPGQGVVDPRWLFLALGEPSTVTAIQNRAIGATMPNLNTTILREVELIVPPLAEQRRIASILGAYDDLIEVNRRRVAVLERQARGLFEEWFVRLRFPGHENHKIIDTPDGPLPEGWAPGDLGDILRLEYGRALKSDTRIDGNVAVIGSSGIVGTHNASFVSGPAVILGRKGNVGSVVWSPGDCWPIDTVYFVVSTCPLTYLFHQLKLIPFQNTDSAVPGLNRTAALKKRIVIPPADLMARFDKAATPMREMHNCLERTITSLAASRDLLLPRLISGELSVAAAELALEAAA